MGFAVTGIARLHLKFMVPSFHDCKLAECILQSQVLGSGFRSTTFVAEANYGFHACSITDHPTNIELTCQVIYHFVKPI